MFLQIWMASLLWLFSGVLAANRPVESDWPRFQGPLGNGSSPEQGLLREWPPDGPKVLWRIPIKQGWGCPSVVGKDVYLAWTEAARGETETIVCLDSDRGSERWHFSYSVGPYWERNIGWAQGGFRSTPCVSGKYVFTLGAVGHLYCLNRKSGKMVWKKNLWEEWNPSGEKGYSFSPLVEDGRLLLWYGDGVSEAKTDSDRHFVLCRALDPETGRRLWEFKEPHRDSARMGEGQTPAVATFAGEKCLVVSANCELKAIRVRDGKEVWKHVCVRLDGRGTTIPTPLVMNQYIVNIPDLDVTRVLEVNRTQPGFPTRVAWEKDLDIFTAIHQFRYRDGCLYGFSGQIQGASEQAAADSTLNLVCLELATGKALWTQGGFRNGISLIEADGLLFVRCYQKLRLIEATPKGYILKGETRTHAVWKPTRNLTDLVMPVLSHGRLFVRTPEELICYQVSR